MSPVPPIIDTFDAGGTFDSGLQWDVNVGPNLGNIAVYLALVTSEHSDKLNFIDTLSVLLQPLADIDAVVGLMPAKYDLDLAVGSQLDAIGERVGVTRNLTVPLTGVYFSWGTAGVGWGEGFWKGPFDPASGLVSLSDESYRTLLRARIANNQWDGTIPGAYAIWDELFVGTGFGILIQDLEDMHMIIALTGPVPDAVTLALVQNGEINLRPAGVGAEYFTPSVPDTPYFGWGVENSSIAGWGVGAWPIVSLSV